MLTSKLDNKYPSPDEEGWELKYKFAKAYEHVAEDIVNFFVGLDSDFVRLSELEKEEEKSVEEA